MVSVSFKSVGKIGRKIWFKTRRNKTKQLTNGNMASKMFAAPLVLTLVPGPAASSIGCAIPILPAPAGSYW